MIRHGYALVALVAICLVYAIVSPKNPLASFRRVMWPWSDVVAPTRVTIASVEPGDATAYQGDNLVVTAEVYGLRPEEPVKLCYSTADGQNIDQEIPMAVPEKDYRYRCELPGNNLGLQQDLEYHLVAGDGASRRFRVEVQIPPTILVETSEYDYPEYTGIPSRTVEHQGDISAIEGTHVTIRATTNQEIDQAFIEFDADPGHRVAMTSKGTSARGGFTLKMDREDPTQPEHASYQLRFIDVRKCEDRRPIRYRIEVIPDQKPEVRFDDRPPEEIHLPLNGSLTLKVHAEDPDFGLRRVAVCAEREGKSLPIRPLLDKPKPQKAHQGPFEQTYRLEPAKLKLKAGDRVQYWAEALDNKEDDKGPAPNRSETEKHWLVIAPEQSQPKESPQAAQGGEQNREQGGQDSKNAEGRQDNNPNEPAGGQEPQNQTKGTRQRPQQGDRQGPQPQNAKDAANPQDRDQQRPDQNGKETHGSGQEPGDKSREPQDSRGKQGTRESSAQQPENQPGGKQENADRQTGENSSGQGTENSNPGREKANPSKPQDGHKSQSPDHPGAHPNSGPIRKPRLETPSRNCWTICTRSKPRRLRTAKREVRNKNRPSRTTNNNRPRTTPSPPTSLKNRTIRASPARKRQAGRSSSQVRPTRV